MSTAAMCAFLVCRRTGSTVFAAAIVAIIAATPVLADPVPRAEYTNLGQGVVGYVVMSAADITSDGSVVVGTGLYPGLPFPKPEAVRWTAETGVVGLGDLPGWRFWSFASAVSNDGQTVVGTSMTEHDGSLDFRPFYWTSATGMLELPFPPESNSGDFGGATDISRDGSIAIGYGGFQEPEFQAFTWSPPGALPGTVPGSIAQSISADGMTIAGSDFDGGAAFYPYLAWIWRAGEGRTMLAPTPSGTGYSQAFAVSADGNVVVGEYESGQDPGGEPLLRAMRWTAADGMQDLGDLLPGGVPVLWSSATATNWDGSVVIGEYGISDGVLDQRAFIWTAADGFRDLDGFLRTRYTVDLGDNVLTRAAAITPNGRWICGDVFDPAAERTLFRVHLIDNPTGDMNCDGLVDFADIDPFVAALGGLQSYEAAQPLCDYTLADANQDGVVDFADIDPFVALLAGG